MPLAVNRYELGPIRTNCYIVRRDPGATEAVVVDPSGEAELLRGELDGMSAKCAGILVTHTHWDHLLAVAELAEATGAPVWAPRGERDRLAEPEHADHRLPVRAHDPEHLVAGGDNVSVAGIDFEVVDVPGHTPGHVAFYADEALFSGDVLFAGSVGRTDLADGDWDQLLASIQTLMERFPPATVVYSGHGPETTLGAELARNPFLAELRAS
jgi:glyoxylase-like metal-dependent hydrolase (beta-lactamase superfamily II)